MALQPWHLILLFLVLIVLAVIVVVVTLSIRGGRAKNPPMSPVAGAGWFPSPDNPQILRWHDGRQWTAHTSPANNPGAGGAPRP